MVITERVPVNTTWDQANSSSNWQCQDNRIVANTICTYQVGDVPAQSNGELSLSFVVKANDFLPADVSIIQNEAFINDDNQNGSIPSGQSSGVVTVPIIRPTALETASEPTDVQMLSLIHI